MQANNCRKGFYLNRKLQAATGNQQINRFFILIFPDSFRINIYPKPAKYPLLYLRYSPDQQKS